MADPIIFTLTTDGKNALQSAVSGGTALALTHVAIGDAAHTASGSEHGLTNERQRVGIASSAKPTVDTLQVSTTFRPSASFWVNEIGLYAGNTLFAIWSYATPTGSPEGLLSIGVDWVFQTTLVFKTIAAANISVTLDPNAAAWQAGLADHLSAADPHPQYSTGSRLVYATVLKSLADTNRLILINNYLNK